MTTEPIGPAYGPANFTGFPGSKDKSAARSIAMEKNRAARARMRARWSSGDVEDTDLERRVLAQERILQALIAHIAETEPKFIARLSALFGETADADRREHDYTDTHAYADQFIQEVLRLIEHRNEPDATRGPSADHLGAAGPAMDSAGAGDGGPVTLLEVSYRSGVWAITKDGQFYGHYIGDQPAFDAAEAVAFAVVAGGGAADVQWSEARRQPAASDQAVDVGDVPITVRRTMKFRAGSTRTAR
jgi:hypothetical protein